MLCRCCPFSFYGPASSSSSSYSIRILSSIIDWNISLSLDSLHKHFIDAHTQRHGLHRNGLGLSFLLRAGSLSLSLTAGAVGMGKKGRAGCADRTFIPEKKRNKREREREMDIIHPSIYLLCIWRSIYINRYIYTYIRIVGLFYKQERAAGWATWKEKRQDPAHFSVHDGSRDRF
jgi:hypothetical protein